MLLIADMDSTMIGQECIQQSAPLDNSDRVPVSLTFEYFAQARSMLLGLGGAVEVIAPAALRASIADFGKQIALDVPGFLNCPLLSAY